MKDNYANKFAAKWPEEVASRGFAPVPKCIVTCAGDLGLKPLEVLVLCNVVEKCWKDGEKAFFGVEYIAANIGRGKSTVIETTNSLVRKGFITKTQRFNSTNLYSLEPCKAKLEEHVKSCGRWWKSRNSDPDVQKAGAPNDQKSSTYIEPELNRNTYIDTDIISHHSKGGDVVSPSGKYKRAICPATGDYHLWNDFEQDRLDANGGSCTYYYKCCATCGMTFHKKDELPFEESFSPSHAQSYEIIEEPINIAEIDF